MVWLVAMSSSVFRPFRHTATAVALVLLTGLCDIGKQVHNEWTTANRQLGTEQKKGTQARKTQKQQQLERRVESLHDKRVKLEAYMNDLFDRYVDCACTHTRCFLQTSDRVILAAYLCTVTETATLSYAWNVFESSECGF